MNEDLRSALGERPACPPVMPGGPSAFRNGGGKDASLQAYKDSGSGAVPVGGNARITDFGWDPQQPGQTVGGLSQLPCSDANCAVGFIGDYFGLAISDHNIYGLFVSTHYPSDVTADGGGPVYYQQQVLATVPRSDFGTGY